MEKNPENRPKVGVGVLVKKGNLVLLGKRKNAHGDGPWCFPGGHLEFGESVEDCAARETLEEAGIKVKNLRKATFTNDIFEKEGKHYVTLFMVCEIESGDVRVMEPDKCERWEWFAWDKLPSPLFIPTGNLVKSGFKPF